MTLDFDEATLIDNTETVQYAVKTGEGAYAAAVLVPLALRRAVTKSGPLLSPPLHREEAHWHLWASQLAPVSVTPKEADRLTGADGVVWVVKGVEKQASSARYRCLCYRAN
jgi:hypothetical protein